VDPLAEGRCHHVVGCDAPGQHHPHHQKYTSLKAEKQYKFNTIRLFMFV